MLPFKIQVLVYNLLSVCTQSVRGPVALLRFPVVHPTPLPHLPPPPHQQPTPQFHPSLSRSLCYCLFLCITFLNFWKVIFDFLSFPTFLSFSPLTLSTAYVSFLYHCLSYSHTMSLLSLLSIYFFVLLFSLFIFPSFPISHIQSLLFLVSLTLPLKCSTFLNFHLIFFLFLPFSLLIFFFLFSFVKTFSCLPSILLFKTLSELWCAHYKRRLTQCRW